MTLMEEVSKLQQRLADAQRERGRAEGAYETAKAIAATARDELERDFGVNTLQDAQDLKLKLQRELAEIVTAINTELDRIGVA